MAFLLFNDRIGRERIKLLLKNNSQLSVLPEYKWLINAIKELDKIMPALSNKGYFYAPDILPMAGQIRLDSSLETEVQGLFVAGETSGFRGIASAAITGIIAIDNICKS